MQKTHLILIRHGETKANQLQVWHGSLDAPLTERGELQVQAVARRMVEVHRQFPVDRVVVSPLPRAQRTAAAIAQAIGVPLQIDAGLREFAIGDWEGRTFRDLAETENLWCRWAADPAFTPPNGESPRSFGERVLHDVPALVERYPGETIVAVTHGGVIGCLLDAWLGESNGDWTRWEPHNCGISLLEWDGVRWHGLLVDDFSHLTEVQSLESRVLDAL